MKDLIEALYLKKPYFDLELLNSNLPYHQEFRIENHPLTFIHLAAIRNPKVLKKILEFKPNLDVFVEIPVSYSSSYFCQLVTPLMYALIHGHKENAQALIEAGADLNARCPISHNNPVSLAIYGQQWDLALMMIKKGGKPSLQERQGNLSILEKMTQYGMAPENLKEAVFKLFPFPSLTQAYPQREYKNFTWRILPDELLRKLQMEDSLEEALNIKSKRIKQIIFSRSLSENYIHFAQLSFYHIISKLDFNYDHLCTLMEKITFPLAHSWTQKRIKSIQQCIKALHSRFNEKTVVKFLINTYQSPYEDLDLMESMWEDVHGMFLMIEHNHRRLLDYFPRKLKNLTQLHDHLAILLAKENQKDFSLPQEDLICSLDGVRFKDFIIKVPKMNHDLIAIGIQMNICVGSGLYAEKINEANSQIFTLNSDHEVEYCIEIDPQSKEIVQAKGHFNELFPRSLLEELQSFLNYRLWWKGREGT